jgi:hypothetical protein
LHFLAAATLGTPLGVVGVASPMSTAAATSPLRRDHLMVEIVTGCEPAATHKPATTAVSDAEFYVADPGFLVRAAVRNDADGISYNPLSVRN